MGRDWPLGTVMIIDWSLGTWVHIQLSQALHSGGESTELDPSARLSKRCDVRWRAILSSGQLLTSADLLDLLKVAGFLARLSFYLFIFLNIYK